jgi:uncharacterized protein YndB with AHSA1/START domain
MPTILHRLTIDAEPSRVQNLVATRDGVAAWWTGRPVTGDDSVGGRIAVSFGDSDRTAAVFEILEQDPDRVVWRVVDGPQDWLDTTIDFTFVPRSNGGTTLLFHHEGWAKESEFMGNCTTNWGAYLMSLKAGAETEQFAPYPGGEVSRAD